MPVERRTRGMLEQVALLPEPQESLNAEAHGIERAEVALVAAIVDRSDYVGAIVRNERRIHRDMLMKMGAIKG